MPFFFPCLSEPFRKGDVGELRDFIAPFIWAGEASGGAAFELKLAPPPVATA